MYKHTSVLVVVRGFCALMKRVRPLCDVACEHAKMSVSELPGLAQAWFCLSCKVSMPLNQTRGLHHPDHGQEDGHARLMKQLMNLGKLTSCNLSSQRLR